MASTSSELSSLPKSVVGDLEELLGSSVLHFESISGGNINRAGKVVLKDSRKFFLKWNAQSPIGFFEAEKHGCDLLRQNGIFAPLVVGLGRVSESSLAYIVMEYREISSLGSEHLETFAHNLARQHQVFSNSYGLDNDNYIGLLPQQNSPSLDLDGSSWEDFFIEYRIKPQADLGSQNGWCSGAFVELLEEKESSIREILASGPQQASLLHGDLWSGNVGSTENTPIVFDPAVYFGSHEADLAMLELFGQVEPRFFDAYREVMPINQGYEVRKHVLNLYHLMNHANLFGGGYVQTVWKVLKAL